MELCIIERLKREDFKRTDHDSQFSEWKILVGPSDWEDHCRGKEGATRYRIHNLPESSGPGLYELGIAKFHDSGSGRNVRKLGSSGIIPVYLGQGANVKTRLQGYGRTGNHLGNFSCGHTNANKDGSSLFNEIFARGYSIVFRWASVENKSIAEKTEARILDSYDYAWNKGRNGASRPNDVLQKLNNRKPVGVKIKACKPLLLDNEYSSHNNERKKLIIPLVFKDMKSRPRLISTNSSPLDDLGGCKVKLALDADKYPINGDLLPICGVTLDDGTRCMRSPIPGRVRCEEHKWRKKCESITNSTTDAGYSKENLYKTKLKSSYQRDMCIRTNNRSLQNEHSICGVELGNGKLCRNQPVVRRQRCEEHKGLRVKPHVPQDERFSGFSTPKDKKCNNSSSRLIEFKSLINNDLSSICGATTLEGSPCTRQPAKGSRRCWQHSDTECKRLVYNDLSSTCGATTLKGSPCMRQRSEGSQRCWQHSDTECRRPVYNYFPSICGATTRKGSPCMRQPAGGSRRCWQH